MTGLLTIRDLDARDLEEMLLLSTMDCGLPLAGKGVALLFQKPSARTRNSMEMAVVQLGGHPVYIQDHEVGLGSRETAEDVANTLACYHALIAARVMDHALLDRMAAATATPLLNMLSDSDHPLQALADLLTMRQLLGTLDGATIAYIGDANNVARSLAEGCAALGVKMNVASPDGYGFSDEEVAKLGIRQTNDPAEAVRGARIVYTDVWVSMGQDATAAERIKALSLYQVDEALMAKSEDAFFLHCLPARRGEEVSGAVLNSPRSAIWQQAENRMHSARGAMAWLLGVRP
ncbi:MAG TPA: ornithine carbamoyltransferase [Sphingomicrobium sp.]|nr:ornithine carbamoyltransferase [Sphingomicrobium sp.]